jgi:hypothetical protein
VRRFVHDKRDGLVHVLVTGAKAYRCGASCAPENWFDARGEKPTCVACAKDQGDYVSAGKNVVSILDWAKKNKS